MEESSSSSSSSYSISDLFSGNTLVQNAETTTANSYYFSTSLTTDPWIQFDFGYSDLRFTGIALRGRGYPDDINSLLKSESENDLNDPGTSQDCVSSTSDSNSNYNNNLLSSKFNPSERECGIVILAGYERCETNTAWGAGCKQKTVGCTGGG